LCEKGIELQIASETRCNRIFMPNVPKMGARATSPAVSAPARRAPANAEAERNLVRRAQAGDQSAYEELVRIHQPRLLAVIGGIMRRSEDVEDVAQQALLKAYLSLKRFDLRSAFGTWLYKIAVNECWDYFRKKKVRPLVYESSLSDEQIRHMEGLPEDREGSFSHSAVDAARRAEQRDLLDRLLVELDEQDRAMLVMKEVAGFTVDEVGEILELNANTVKVRLFRARGRLVEIFRRRLKTLPAKPSARRKLGDN
jgi:RNA polymerase sigma-70 factor (ECF subfamily)